MEISQIINKKYINLILMLLVFSFTIIAYAIFTKTSQFNDFVNWTQNHIFIYIGFLIVIKVLGIVYPPIPGGIFTLASIPILGWQRAFATDLIGSLIGGTICYFLGKKYGINLLGKLFDKEVISEIQNLKVKKEKELEGFIIWKILAGGTIVEAIYYGAGLLNISFTNFILGTIISHLIIGIPSYYLGGAILSSQNIIINVLLILITVLVLYKLRGGYFE